MTSAKIRNVAGWVLIILIAVAFLMAAAGKLTGAATSMFEHWGYPAWFATLIGVLELAGSVGLLIPKTTRLAIIGLSVIMLGAIYTHSINGEGWQVLRPLLFLAVLWAIWWLRWAPGKGAIPAQP